MKKTRTGSLEHAAKLLATFPKDARDFLAPDNPLLVAVIKAQDDKDTQRPDQPAADGLDLEGMTARVRARCSVILAALMCGKTHRELEKDGFSWPEITNYKRHYPSFNLLYVRSMEIATEYRAAVRLEEAHSRAVDGWNEPIYFQGRKCGSVRRFSDKLLALLLAGDDPARFSTHKQVDVSHTHETGDRLTALLNEIADRGRFDPVRDLAGGPRPVPGVASAPRFAATKPQPDQGIGPKTLQIEAEATDSGSAATDKTDISKDSGTGAVEVGEGSCGDDANE